MPTEKKDKKPVVKRAPRTPKEKAFAKEYIANGGNGTQAALKTYDTNSYQSAQRIGHDNVTKLNLSDMFERTAGLRTQDLLLKLVEGLYAEKRDQFSGETAADYSVRHKYLDLAYRLNGSLQAGTTINATQNNITVTPILSGLSQGEDKEDDGN